MGSISDEEVHERTGFRTLEMLLSYIIVVCDDSKRICYCKSELTWFEEWFFYFEMMKRENMGWKIPSFRSIGYARSKTTLRGVFDDKLAKESAARESWSMFASYEEEQELMTDDSKQKPYKNKRAIMWDMTNIVIPKPGDADLQRRTYSKYYGHNCFKGSVGLQLCGWIITYDLWLGAVSDTMYQEKCGVLKLQEDFARYDKVDDKEIPFLNIFDKGYRIRLAAWRNGNQLVLQPHFAKSDEKFSGKATLSSASMAADRSANERAVRLAKQPGYLK